MDIVQILAIVVSMAFTVVAVATAVVGVRSLLKVIRIGGPAMARSDQPGRRTITMLKETVGHTRMLQWTWIGIMHWLVFAGFIFLSSAVLTAYFQIFDPHYTLWIVGEWYPFEWATELLSWLTVLGIAYLIYVRQKNHPRRLGRKSRFFGSNFWQAYFVESIILGEGVAGLLIRGAEYQLHDGTRAHFPLTWWIGSLYGDISDHTAENIILLIATAKILMATIWLTVLCRNLTMGVAWHRFTAWFNIWFKRESDGGLALGAMKPLTSNGTPITLDDIEDLDEDSRLGVGAIEDYSWKGILDFTTCTECGRCQSQCPAWNTEKPLSPKLLITAMRDHAHAKAPYLQAGGEGSEAATALLENDPALAREVARPLVGDTGDDWFYMPESGAAVIDPDVLWSCTNCGACVQQCPVDIEHVDHIEDMRRYQVLVESNFPAELNGLFKGLENKGNPWNMSPNARLDWAKDLDFEVKVVGDDIESLDEVDWLFWVGCAGAYEDRAKKTTRAVAELLDMAGVSFGVLGNGETCSGDPARRAGNEFVFQGLAQQNVETFQEYKVKKVVSTCAHCFNTLKNEYKQFGVELEVVHHTQLLNRLVREGRLTPVTDGAGAHKRSITYHDPCFIGRHNGVYTPPRELLEILPGAEYVEMERNSERSFCCGAGGARMWMEENLGERINVNRTREAVGTGADQIAVGCPFCRVMLSDGLTAEQSAGAAREEVEVLDVAQMLLASVKGEMATKLAPGAPAPAMAKAAPTDPATKAEPEAGDATITENTVVDTEDAGPAAKASGGSSLFDTPAESETAAPQKPAAEEAQAAKPASSGGSLFDLGGDEPAKAEPKAESKPASSGGSLFDLGGDEPEAKAKPEPQAEPKASKPASQTETTLGSGGSLFDLGNDEPETPVPAAPKAEAPKAEAPKSAPAKASAPKADIDLGSGGSLFDIATEEPAASQPAEPAVATSAEEPTQPVASQPTAPVEQAATSTPATEIPEGGSLFDIAAPEAAEPVKPVEPVVEEEPAAAAEPQAPPAAPAAPAASSGAASTPVSDVDFDSLGSLFDIAAPEPTTAGAPTAAQPAEAKPAEASAEVAPPEAAEPEPTTEPTDGQPSGAEVSAAATAIAGGTATATPEAPEETEVEAQPELETEVEVEVEPEAEVEVEAQPAAEPATEAPAERPKPSSNGAAHTPRTDVEISEGRSLFDL
uniref:heterodisulfide reductase-related iron-sulfur binding cluster n=1 Tax=Nocardioides pantholopis TaxID=2483798 RepID=UPI000F091291